MKKLLISKTISAFAVLMVMFCLICAGESTQASSGYIVSLKEAPAMLLYGENSANYIDDTLYTVDSIEEAYRIFGKENIKGCFPDYEMELFDTGYPITTNDTYFPNQWYHKSIGAEYSRNSGLTGNGVRIAVIDSGVNTEHPDFDGVQFEIGYNCAEGATDIYDVSDMVGHGTMVTGIIASCTDNNLGIAGLASDALIIPIKITESQTFGFSAILKAIKKALEIGCDIINLSLGGPLEDDLALAELKKYVDEAEEKGIIVVSAVGNSAHIDNCVNYPAYFENVIGVGSVDENNAVTYFSQRNNGVNVCAPGVKISTLTYDGSVIHSAIGTSFSAPIVTSTLAMVKQVCKDFDTEKIMDLLSTTSLDMGNAGYDISYGYGVINIGNIISTISAYIPDIVVTQAPASSVRVHNNFDSAVSLNLVLTKNVGEENGLLCSTALFDRGVTTIRYGDGYGSLMVLGSNLKPYTKKIILK